MCYLFRKYQFGGLINIDIKLNKIMILLLFFLLGLLILVSQRIEDLIGN